MMFKKNNKGVITVYFLVQWIITVFVYFTIVGLIITARDSVLSQLSTIEAIIAGLVILTPMWGLIQSLITKSKEVE